MSEDQTAVSNSDHQASGDDVNSKASDTVSYESHQKLLSQHKNQRARLQELEEFKKNMELKAEEEKGNLTGVIETLRNELREERERVKKTTEKIAFDKFSSQVKSVAKEHGCVDTDGLMKLLSKEQIASVQVDDKLNANTDDIQRLIGQFKEKKSYMFGSRPVNHTPVNLGGGFRKEEPKPLKGMTKEEIKEFARKNL